MEKSSKLKITNTIQPQKKILRNAVLPKQSSVEIKPRIQRLCTISGIPAKNPIPHGHHSLAIPVIPLNPPKTNVAHLQSNKKLDSERTGSWESILAANTKSTRKPPTNTVPSLELSTSTTPTPVTNYNHVTHQHERTNNHDTTSHAMNFHSFDPIRTLQFLTLELKAKIKLHLPDEMNLHRIVSEIQQTIKRLSTVSTSTAIIESCSMAGGDERRIIRDEYHSVISGHDSVSGQFAIAAHNRKTYKNQIVQTEDKVVLSPSKKTVELKSRGDNTDRRSSLKKASSENMDLEVSNIHLQHEVSKYHNELQNLRKRQHKLEDSLKSRDKQIHQLQKELTDIESLMKEQINLMYKDNIYIDLKHGGGSGNRSERTPNSNYQKSEILQNNISSSTSFTNLQNVARSQKEFEPQAKQNNLEYEKLFSKPQLKSPGNSPPTLIPPRVSLSMENYKGDGKDKNRRYSESLSKKSGFYPDDSGDNDDDIIRSKKKLAEAALNLNETKNLKEINLNMDEIKAIFNDVKLPSPPRKFQQELPSFM